MKPATPNVATPKEKTRESSRLGDRLAVPEIPDAAPSAVTLPSQIATAVLAATTEPPPVPETWGNNDTSWDYNTAANNAVAGIEVLADKVVEEPLPEPKGTKKKGGKASSKLASKAASVAPTPGAITPSKPKERSPNNDWAKLGDMSAPPVDPVTAAFANASATPSYGAADIPKAIDDLNKQSGASGPAETSVANAIPTWDKHAGDPQDTLLVDGTKNRGWGADIPANNSNTTWGTSAENASDASVPGDSKKKNGSWGITDTPETNLNVSWDMAAQKSLDTLVGGSTKKRGLAETSPLNSNAKSAESIHHTLPPVETSTANSNPFWDGTMGRSTEQPTSSWRGFDGGFDGGHDSSWDLNGPAGVADQAPHESSGAGLGGWSMDFLSGPAASGVNASSSHSVTDLSDALGLGKSSPKLKTSHTSKHSSPKPALNPLSSESDANKAAGDIEQASIKLSPTLNTPHTSKHPSPTPAPAPSLDPPVSEADGNKAADTARTPVKSSPALKASRISKPSSPKLTLDPLPSEFDTIIAASTKQTPDKPSPLLKASHTSKPPSPKVTPDPPFLPSEIEVTQAAASIEPTSITPAVDDPPALAGTKAVEQKEDIDEDIGPNGKPLTPRQKTASKKKKEKEAKEKADREFQEQHRKELAEEANGGGDSWNDGNAEGGEWSGQDVNLDDPKNDGDGKQDGDTKKDDGKKEEDDDWVGAAKNSKKKKKKGK